ncbi:hypothetical protein JXJ21_21410 [candidate division KSB1 bacterium]|nr:hypothetical protein [candidate division KSB1 bacterium]
MFAIRFESTQAHRTIKFSKLAIFFMVLVVFSCSSDKKSLDYAEKISFELPSSEYPFYHAEIIFSADSTTDLLVQNLFINDREERDFIIYNNGVESYKNEILSSSNVVIITRCDWQSDETIQFKIEGQDSREKPASFKFEHRTPSDRAGYWNPDWQHYYSFVVDETRGIDRVNEPIQVALGIFADEIAEPEREIRVISFEPNNTGANADGYVSHPFQIVRTSTWNDAKILAIKETDQKSGNEIHRYDPTTTVELLFEADIKANESKVFLVFYGNSKANTEAFSTDLKVTGKEPGQQIENSFYRFELSQNSGSIETVTLKAEKPYLFEHKLETNGAVHWNPGIYAPPMPWVHASDWENPAFSQISGPLMHRTQRYAHLPHMKNVDAGISYNFYANLPYMLVSSVMEVQEDIFVKALRNGEIVFNHAILNEFVWETPTGEIRSLDIEPSRPHPGHAIEIPPDTPWMAFVNCEEKVGFAGINIAFENGNLYGAPASLAQPYIYVANGPWIYWSRALVYPFGDHALTRMMPVRAGSFYIERNAYLPFKFSEEGNPYAEVQKWVSQLKNPVKVRHWVPTGLRTPREWIMPILTAPFDEGVEGAMGSHTKEIEESKKNK